MGKKYFWGIVIVALLVLSLILLFAPKNFEEELTPNSLSGIVSAADTPNPNSHFWNISKEEKVKTNIHDTGINISKWNDEVEFYLELPQVVNTEILPDGSVRIYHGQYEGLFYMSNEDEFEWEIHMPKVPNQDCFSFPIQTRNLDFYYQAPFDERHNNYTHCNETACWDTSGDILVSADSRKVGSYAVYHSSKMNNEYKTGKAFHIDRPFVTHSLGTDWLDLNIDGETFEVCGFKSLPKGAEDLVIDPTFGYTGVGAGDCSPEAQYRLNMNWEWTNLTYGKGQIDTGFIHASENAGYENYLKVYYYEQKDSLASTNLIGNTSVFEVTSSSGIWYEKPASGVVENGRTYITGFQANTSAEIYRVRVQCDNLGWGSERYVTDTDWDAPATLAGASTDSYRFSTYFNYTLDDTCIDGFCEFGANKIMADIQTCEGGGRGTDCLSGDKGVQIKWDIQDLCDLDPSSIDSAFMQFNITGVGGSPDNDIVVNFTADQSWTESNTTAEIDSQLMINETLGTLSSITDGTFTNVSVLTQMRQACNQGNNVTFRIYDPDSPLDSIAAVENTDELVFGDDSISPENLGFVPREGISGQRPILYVEYTLGVEDSPPTVTGLTPTSNSVIIGDQDTLMNFSCTTTDTTLNIANITLNVYNSTGSIFYNVTNITEFDASSGAITNFSNINIGLNDSTYNYSCTSIDTGGLSGASTNITFFRGNFSYPNVSAGIFSKYRFPWHRIENPVTDQEIKFKPPIVTCNFTDMGRFDYVALYETGSVFWPLFDVPTVDANFTDLPFNEKPMQYNLSVSIENYADGSRIDDDDIFEDVGFNCYARSSNGTEIFYGGLTEKDQNITLIINTTPRIYAVTAIDTETKQLDITIFNQTLIYDNFAIEDENSETWRAFWEDDAGTVVPGFRLIPDSFGDFSKLTWFNMVTRVYWKAENAPSKDPVFDQLSNFSTNLEGFGDDLEFHYHPHFCYNFGDYEDDFDAGIFDGEPYPPCTNWWALNDFYDVQVLINITGVENRTAVENLEEIIAQRIINAETLPSTYRAGWLWEDSNFSSWINEVIKYDFSLNNELGDGGRGVANNYNWSGVTTQDWQPYQPKYGDYQAQGDMKRWLFYCQTGLDQDDGDLAVNLSYYIGNVIVCAYTHNYGGAGAIPGAALQVFNAINDSIADSSVPINFSYATAHEAAKAFDQEFDCINDDTPPEFIITKDEDWIYLSVGETPYAEPFLALENGTNHYIRGVLEEDGENAWKGSRNQIGITSFAASVADNCGNTISVTQNIVDDVQITSPTQLNPALIEFPQNITVNFTVREDGEFLESGVTIINITAGTSDLCVIKDDLTYAGNNIWQQNCSTPDLSGLQNLTIWINHFNIGNKTDNETNALQYSSCTYSGSGDWIVKCNDHCDISSEVNLRDNTLYLTGTGSFRVSGSIFVDKIIKRPTCRWIGVNFLKMQGT